MGNVVGTDKMTLCGARKFIFSYPMEMSAFSIIKSLKKRVRLLIPRIFPFSTV